MVKEVSPRRPVMRNVVAAFLLGGMICALAQIPFQLLLDQGMSPKEAAGPTISLVIFLGALLTGIGVYDELGRRAGMGAALPISGFSNAIVSAAMENKSEGLVLGVGARMFVVAGPVIVYGIASAFLVAGVRWLLE